MTMVWILIVMMYGYTNNYGVNGVVIVDNIADKANCERVAEHFKVMDLNYKKADTRCVQVVKIR